jgi:hypothetical protein
VGAPPGHIIFYFFFLFFFFLPQFSSPLLPAAARPPPGRPPRGGRLQPGTIARRDGGHQAAPRREPPREGPPAPPRGPPGPHRHPPWPPPGPPQDPPRAFSCCLCSEFGSGCGVVPGERPRGGPPGPASGPRPPIGGAPPRGDEGKGFISNKHKQHENMRRDMVRSTAKEG